MFEPATDTVLQELSKQIDHLHRQVAQWQLTLRSSHRDRVMEQTTVHEWYQFFKDLQRTNMDLVVQHISVPQEPGGSSPGLVIYLSSLVSESRLLAAIPYLGPSTPDFTAAPDATWHIIPTQEVLSFTDAVAAYLTGKVVLFIEGSPGAVSIDLANPPHASISSTQTELSIRGPQEAFSDLLTEQIGQLRRRLNTPELVVEDVIIGVRIPCHLALIYVDSLADSEVVTTVKQRLAAITIDNAVSATRIGSLIRDNPWSIFPTVRYSERADWVALEIQQGKVAVFVNGDPFALTMPATLADFYRTSADYNSAWYDTSFVRGIRLLAWAFGIFLPAIYIALTEVNPSLISPKLFDLTAGSHTGLPFTPLVEVVVMIIIIEILREAAQRLPKILASTIGTVGAIVIGTAVVKAGFVSPQIIVLMTLTALSLFSVPTYELIGTWRLIGWAMLIASFLLGVYGLSLAIVWLTIEMVSLQSFGTPYFVPWSPLRRSDWANTLWRLPWSALTRRLTEGRAIHLSWQSPLRKRP